MTLGKNIKGYSLGVVAAATYGLNPLFALPLYADGMDANSVLLFRYLAGIPIVAIVALLSGDGLFVRRREIIPLIVMGLLMGYSSLSLFESYNCMEASIASTMLFVYPLMVAVIMTVMYRERFTWLTGICLVTAGAGLILLYNGKPGATLDPVGVAWVMTSALSYAIVLVGINRSVLATMPSNRMTFYLLLFGSVIFIIPAAIKGSVIVPTDNTLWRNVLAVGLLPTAVSLICPAVAIHCIGSTPVALLGVFEPVTA
ncbi:MAG: DMT family transporter, partial [Muribaculaceae bacterium]|nr:DMT family transporter [Muribaculaceae bacterium]